MTKKLGSFAVVVAGFAMACSDPAGPTRALLPTASTLALNPDEGYPFPSSPTDGLVTLCKVSNVAGTFGFDVSVNGGTATQVSITVDPGEENTRVCRTDPLLNSDVGSGQVETVAIVEDDPGAGVTVTVDIDQYFDEDIPYHPSALLDEFDVAPRTATVFINDDLEKRVTFNNTYPPPPPGAVLLIIDEDGIDNGLHYNGSGGLITPGGPNFFSVLGVNDDKPDKKQRDVLRFFANNIGRTITVRTGQTGDEGWFAPNCIPAKFIASNNKEDNTCLTNGARQTGINNFFGVPTESAVPEQERLDKVPHVIPLRALGLNALIGKTVCAVVYDSDVSVNYDHDKPDMGVNGNLQGETLGIVAFDVDQVRTLNGFSSSTLPQVTITIRSTSVCGNWVLFNAPVPKSSSVPNDRIAPGSPTGYKSLSVWGALQTFY